MSLLELTFYTIPIAILLYYFLTITRSLKPLPPGPKPWPIIGNLPHMGPVPHQGLAVLAQKFGEIMHLRLGYVNVVVASSAQAAAQFLKTHDANFSSRPPNSIAKYILQQDLVFASYGPRWKRLRKLCTIHLFSTKALDDFKHLRKEEVSILIKTLANAGTKTVQLGQLLYACTINNLSRMMLGRRFFGDNDPKAEEFMNMVLELMVLGGLFNVGDFIPTLEWLDLQGGSKMKKLHKKFDGLFSAILEEHKAKGGQCGDMLSTLISLKDNCDGEGGKLSDKEIKDLLLDLFVGASNTSSSTIEWAIAELIRHPRILAKVQQEIDSVVGRDRLVNEADLPKLVYFQAVIKEVFRLHPSIPLSLPHMSVEPCEINGYHIPRNTTLFVNVWAIARDPNVWTNPLEFQPERFLQGGERPNVDVKGTDFELIPFGAGRRVCVGIGMGLRQVQLLAATLAHAFEWNLGHGLTPEKLNMEEDYGLTLQRKVPLSVHPKPRLSPNAYV